LSASICSICAHLRSVSTWSNQLLRALITGIGGFAGSHLAEFLHARGDVEIHGAVYLPNERIAVPATAYRGDLLDREYVRSMVEAVRPDLVFHLAAQASVAAAWADPGATINNNVAAEANLLDAVAKSAPQARVLVVGSAETYGIVRPDELPLTERQPFRPNNPYAVSKIAQEMLGYQYSVSPGLRVVLARPFNHIGPRQRPDFVAAAFARQVALAEAGQIEPVIRVGNLDARRDFLDVRDVVRAYYLMLTAGSSGEAYNIASGRAVAIREMLDILLSLSRRPLRVESDPARARPSDIPELRGDATKLREATGWRPDYTLEQSLRDTLDFWRDVVRNADERR
jgi:GDP-4-dehydro-6-deoxy-D-mannose reductase